MKRRAFLLSTVIAPAFGQKKFTDPAQPKVTPQTGAALAAQANSEATFRKKPGALNKSAVTEEWPCFLGSTHNAHSKETKLIKKFPATGPQLVWEMNKGTGYSSPSVSNGKLVFFHRKAAQEVVECLDPETGERRIAYARLRSAGSG